VRILGVLLRRQGCRLESAVVVGLIGDKEKRSGECSGMSGGGRETFQKKCLSPGWPRPTPTRATSPQQARSWLWRAISLPLPTQPARLRPTSTLPELDHTRLGCDRLRSSLGPLALELSRPFFSHIEQCYSHISRHWYCDYCIHAGKKGDAPPVWFHWSLKQANTVVGLASSNTAPRNR
jgi:hypothetical protein